MDRFKTSADAVDLCYFIKSGKISISNNPIPALYFNVGINPAVDGSAYLEYNRVKVICSVCGPVELKQDGQLLTNFKFAPFSSQVRCDNSKESEEKRLNQLLLTALEPCVVLDSFPRGKYQIAVTILDDGTLPGDHLRNTASCLSAGITCASIALVHSGVQMYDLAIGLDIPTSALSSTTSENNTITSSVAVMPKLRQVNMLNITSLSLSSVDGLRKVLNEAFQWADAVYSNIQANFLSVMKSEYETTEKSKQ